VFAALAFVHLCLYELERLRAGEKIAPGERLEARG
jgi:hypothetical protein